MRFVLLLLVALTACTPAPESVWVGDYRVALQLPGGELPFALSINATDGRLEAVITNGEEKLRIDEVTVDDGTLLMRMPGYENRITARREGGQLRGELFMVKSRGRHQRIPFVAQRDVPRRFFPEPAPPGGDVSGRWAVTFTDEEGGSYPAVGEFRQAGSDVTGTFLTPTGDYRFLTGEMREGRLFLGTFNGGHVFLFHATLTGDERLEGDYWSGLAWHEKFVAKRDESADLGATTQVTAVRKQTEPLAFTFPDLAGKPVSLADPQFAGRVVIVSLGGSWCPNCGDEVPFLLEMQKRYGPEGLQVIGLMFEQLIDPAEARAAITRYRDHWSITWPLLHAGTVPVTEPEKILPQLNGIFGYPTTLFVDRKGLVRHIHTGFAGPATGEHYTRLTRDFEERIQALLAEKS